MTLLDINDILEKIIDYRIFNDYQYNNKLISILYSVLHMDLMKLLCIYKIENLEYL